MDSGEQYDFQLMSFRTSAGGQWVDARYSNTVSVTPTATTAARPVTDLTVVATTDASLRVRWTEVDDGAGGPAWYRLKYDDHSFHWGSAQVGCAAAIQGVGPGSSMTCTIHALDAGTEYHVQVMSYRNVDGLWEGAKYSNTATGTTTPDASTTGVASSGIWIDRSELMSRPMAGAAWNNLLTEASLDCGWPRLEEMADDVNVCIMAKALVFARTGQAPLRADVVTALTRLVDAGTFEGTALSLGRELGAFVLAADLIDLATYQPTLDQAFRSKLQELLYTPTDGGPATLIECHELRPNNWGTHCGGTRAAIAAYLDDTEQLERVAQVFKGWLGDRASYAGFKFGDTSWQCDPFNPVGINPMGCRRDGHDIDGVLGDDQRRAGAFAWPAVRENYVWEALQGAVMQAVILERAGYPAFEWQDQALLRAAQWLHVNVSYPAEGDDTWVPHVLNHFYGSSFPAPNPARAGKNAGWTDWTHG